MASDAIMQADFPSEIEIIVRLDEDDPEDYGWTDEAVHVSAFTGPRQTLSDLWNQCARMATGDILMQCADDIRFRTQGWDSLVREAFDNYPDKIAYVYGRDGIADKRMATHGFMHRRWYEALGYFTWPEFTSDYGDLWNHTIAERLGRLHFIEELYTEHLHPAVGKAPIDETHRERMERDEGGVNEQIWQDAQPHLTEAVASLAELLQG